MKSSSAVSSAQRPASVPRRTGMGLRYRAQADESIRPKSCPALGDQLHHRLYASSPRPSRPLGRFMSNPGSVGISTGALTGSQGSRLWIIPRARPPRGLCRRALSGMWCAEAPLGIAVGNGRRYPIGPVIEGYSVDEAASVLGVPKGRVWELLARGVLAGTPEDGGGMRVYLQGRPMEPIVGRPLPGQAEERGERPAGPNGNGGEHSQPGSEASPFRELLTEFRNLTERYGQALLALGEARGEVASLRTRVDQLEARFDLRLPPPLD